MRQGNFYGCLYSVPLPLNCPAHPDRGYLLYAEGFADPAEDGSIYRYCMYEAYWWW